jgi:hypothetical protein
MFFALNNALLDASITAWDGKRTRDSVRPITARLTSTCDDPLPHPNGRA